jgi:hypothetical protein
VGRQAGRHSGNWIVAVKDKYSRDEGRREKDMRAVEARSLSSLVDLAENPPISLQDSFQVLSDRGGGGEGGKNEELRQVVLYVARVPGSRGMYVTVWTRDDIR